MPNTSVLPAQIMSPVTECTSPCNNYGITGYVSSSAAQHDNNRHSVQNWCPLGALLGNAHATRSRSLFVCACACACACACRVAGFGDGNDSNNDSTDGRPTSVASNNSDLDLDDLDNDGFGMTPQEQAASDKEHATAYSKDSAFANALTEDSEQEDDDANRKALSDLLLGRATGLTTTLDKIDPSQLKFDVPSNFGRRGSGKVSQVDNLTSTAPAEARGEFEMSDWDAITGTAGIPSATKPKAKKAAKKTEPAAPLNAAQSIIAKKETAGQRKIRERAKMRAEMMKSAKSTVATSQKKLPKTPVPQWGEDEVKMWLRSLVAHSSVEQWMTIVQKHKIDGMALLELNLYDLNAFTANYITVGLVWLVQPKPTIPAFCLVFAANG